MEILNYKLPRTKFLDRQRNNNNADVVLNFEGKRQDLKILEYRLIGDSLSNFQQHFPLQKLSFRLC